jgi:hypothetical protein
MGKVDESMLLQHIISVDFAMAASQNGVCITQQNWHILILIPVKKDQSCQ